MKKWTLIIGIAVGVVALMPFWLGALFPDGDEPNTEDLILEWWEPEFNAYEPLSHLGQDGFDTTVVFEEAAKADAYLDPQLMTEAPSVQWYTPSLREFLPHVQEELDEIAEVSEEEQKDRLKNLLDVTQMIQNSPGPLLQVLVAMQAKQLVLEEAVKTDLDLSSYGNNESGLVNAYRFEFLLSKTLVNDEAFVEEFGNVLWFESSFFFHPNDTIDLFAGHTRELIAGVETACDETLIYEDQEQNFNINLIQENSIGLLIFEALKLGKSSGPHELKCELDALLSE